MLRTRKTLQEQVNKKLDKEFKKFMKELKNKDIKEIINSSHKKVYFEELKNTLKERDNTIIEKRTIINTDDFLNTMFKIQQKSDKDRKEMFNLIIDKELSILVEQYKTDKKNKQDKGK